ncbi:MAG: radical SAM protein [Candidatus Pacearchaeota archaeon]
MQINEHLPNVDYLLLDLIASCNLNCLHCRASGFDKKSILPFDTIELILLNAKKVGVKTITFSGGEPFTRDDIFDLINLVKNKGFILRIQSNILLLNEQKIKKLKELGVDYIGTGIDGLEKNHNKLRNKKGAFKKVIENIKILKKYGMKIHVEFTATKFNFEDFEDVMKLCERLGIYDVMTRAVLPSGRGRDFDFSLTKDQYKKFLQKVISIKKGKINVKLYCQDPVSLYLDKERIKKLEDKYSLMNFIGGCSAGINMLYISPLGEVQPCSFLDISFGNIKNNSLTEIINSKKRKDFLSKQVSRDFGTKCSSCNIRFLCGGCRARALNFNKELWGDDPFCFRD